MNEQIEMGFMAFVAEGREGIGAVRGVSPDSLVIFVENAGEFIVPMRAVSRVHDQKVMLNPRLLDKALLDAIGHVHDNEDPKLVG
jgi:hypothetical protein